ncbi:2-C-methyl-D-erythritol 2,4-cyclodiphosphate synthase [Granulosicoccus antarcticus]|uniref:2-C-methyl-D-erythritol 2,4-cyclodiphosphate synthase n=1 Tax=Granulosicoccus antarcticus IMCC3135 TaxID=1192854 RepID=A0A2Z2NTL1_9GAMM|nr:2-C-methyl-D-erythritol 2,4-cyclodiphosphate synthase [Granulosicoccus antarcticus]ASJ74826.1 2-C-methyl-D-erythritol 2,4-cyclodiphosphate synthase [Granulosicoccus antarcticus IMCC3135]
MRIGSGFDVHAFMEGDHLMLGGVRIDFEKAFRAHSDGDVLLHAISDALLGAAGLGDIGRHFPDTDAAYKGADSRDLLRQVVAQLSERGLQCTSLDATIIAQRPKMSPHIATICQILAADLQMELSRINVKATTTEQLGFCGREEGIAAMASVLLSESGELTQGSV